MSAVRFLWQGLWLAAYALRRALAEMASDKRDLVILLGLAIGGWGLWRWEPVAAPIVIGVALILIGLFWNPPA